VIIEMKHKQDILHACSGILFFALAAVLLFSGEEVSFWGSLVIANVWVATMNGK
jgi:hypothetical protein